MVSRRPVVHAGRMGTTSAGPHYRSALACVASFIGALQQVRRSDMDLADNVPADDRGSAESAVPTARNADERWASTRHG
jgi:hypothetical protein